MTDISPLLSLATTTDEIQDRVNNLFHLMLDQAELLMRTGSTATKIKLISTAVPAMMSYMKAEDGSQYAALRQVFLELNAELRTQLFPAADPPSELVP